MATVEAVAETVAATPGMRDEVRACKEELVRKMFGKRTKRRREAVADAAAAEVVVEGVMYTPELRRATLEPIPTDANVQGIGFGAKNTLGAGLDDLAVRVYVRAKVPRSKLTKRECVPESVNGYPTDVVQVGEVQAAAVRCGVSVGHVKVTAGTIGCVVTKHGKRYILSNNHILANVNNAKAGDHIIQPGSLDGGKEPHIATLTDWEPIRFGSAANSIDAAIAELLEPPGVDPELEVIGPVTQPVTEPAVFQSVRKHGRTTLHTIGVIMDAAADIKVRFGNRIAWFEDQLAISGVNGLFADHGDSGSLVVDAVSRRPVALLCAVSAGTTFCNPILPVLERFGVEIAFGV